MINLPTGITKEPRRGVTWGMPLKCVLSGKSDSCYVEKARGRSVKDTLWAGSVRLKHCVFRMSFCVLLLPVAAGCVDTSLCCPCTWILPTPCRSSVLRFLKLLTCLQRINDIVTSWCTVVMLETDDFSFSNVGVILHVIGI